MILVDVNLLVYAHMSPTAEHDAALAWLDGQLGEGTRIGLPWASLLGFMRVATNPRAFSRPQSVRGAWAQVEAWLDSGNVWIPEAGASHRPILSRLLEHLGGSARLISDAYLAALAIEHGLTLCSTDGDFARFQGLRWQNPLNLTRQLPSRR